MFNFHQFLQKQLERYLDSRQVSELNSFLEAIDKTYRDFDISLRKAKQAAELSNSELRIATTEFKAVLEAFPDQFVWLDKSGRVIQVQGNSLDNSIQVGRYFWDAPEEDIRRLRRRAFERVWKKEITVEYYREDPEPRHFEARVYPVVNGRMIAIVRDMTRFKTLEGTLTHAKEAAEQADRTKSDFLAMMSHELRTPMNAIIGMNDLLAETRLDEEQRDISKTIGESGTLLLSIINDVLDFSKIESGELKTEQIAFELQQHMREAVDVVTPLAQLKGLNIELYIDPALPPRIVSDPLRIKQIVMNLVSNGIKFTEQGSITIRCESAQLENGRPALLTRVIDTGLGISDEQLQKLFKPFSQADSSTTRRFGGTGLGLVISKQLSEALGGELRVSSVPGEGSCFSFNLPLVEPRRDSDFADKSSTPMATEERVEFPGCKVLVVEDNSVNRKVATAILHKLKVDVTHAENGEIAIEKVQNEAFDLILMDCSMPVMDGYEATRIIRSMPEPVCTIPIIALTANALAGDESRCREAGMDGYISKPLRYATVRDNLAHWRDESTNNSGASRE
jgi:signal transduction histidine kinase/CheY-like chemotaxis protein